MGNERLDMIEDKADEASEILQEAGITDNSDIEYFLGHVCLKAVRSKADMISVLSGALYNELCLIISIDAEEKMRKIMEEYGFKKKLEKGIIEDE